MRNIITVQEFKIVAWDTLTGLRTLHQNGQTHRDIRAANACWTLNSQTVHVSLVDLSTCGPTKRRPRVHLKDWRIQQPSQLLEGGTFTLTNDGLYTQASDIRQLGVMLQRLSSCQPWEAASRSLVDALISQQLSARSAQAHDYFEQFRAGL